MASYMTIAEIVAEGIKQAGNPGITTRAQAFLIAWLNHMALSYDWEFLLAEASVVTSNRHEVSLAAVTDFRNIDVLKLDGITVDLEQMDYRELWVLLQQAIEDDAGGTPAYFAPTPDRSKLLLYPRPPSGTVYSGKILYYKQPDPTDYTSASNPEFDDTLALIAGVAHFAQVYDKEPLQVTIKVLSSEYFGQYRAAHENKGRNKPQTMKWGRSFTPMKQQ